MNNLVEEKYPHFYVLLVVIEEPFLELYRCNFAGFMWFKFVPK